MLFHNSEVQLGISNHDSKIGSHMRVQINVKKSLVMCICMKSLAQKGLEHFRDGELNFFVI